MRMLLAMQPVQRAARGRREAPLQDAPGTQPVEDAQRDQPPQGRVNAADVPEVGPLAAGVLYDRAIAAPFWLAACLLVVTAAIARGLPEKNAARTTLAEPELTR